MPTQGQDDDGGEAAQEAHLLTWKQKTHLHKEWLTQNTYWTRQKTSDHKKGNKSPCNAVGQRKKGISKGRYRTCTLGRALWRRKCPHTLGRFLSSRKISLGGGGASFPVATRRQQDTGSRGLAWVGAKLCPRSIWAPILPRQQKPQEHPWRPEGLQSGAPQCRRKQTPQSWRCSWGDEVGYGSLLVGGEQG